MRCCQIVPAGQFRPASAHGRTVTGSNSPVTELQMVHDNCNAGVRIFCAGAVAGARSAAFSPMYSSAVQAGRITGERWESRLGIDEGILRDNAEQLARLEALAAREIDFSRDLGGGWTVGVALAHMAFWDRRAVGLLKLWDGEGRLPDSIYEDLLNDLLLPEWLAIEPPKAMELAVDAARAVNAAVESLEPDKADAIVMMGNQFMLARGNHRREHLDQIEEALG